ncbi:MAG: hypothetical protein U9Q24_00915 [Candidatus Ratteibacteria bacterium]|nr:hypothetical protein [Candidatus Ratteibacteria bacterium]
MTLLLSLFGWSDGYTLSKNMNTVSVNTSSINRTFEDLTLGMTENELKSKLVYFGPSSRSWLLHNEYSVYSVYYNIYIANENPRMGKITPKMKEIENVYAVYCSFYENKLFRIKIVYRNAYQLPWGDFIFNAKQKYGPGKKMIDGVTWNDGMTTLIITQKHGKQFENDYGKHYEVFYIDNKQFSKMNEKMKEESPQL